MFTRRQIIQVNSTGIWTVGWVERSETRRALLICGVVAGFAAFYPPTVLCLTEFI
jgi:hypothetical protein